LPKTLASINDYLLKQSYDYEILVVDNGSKDRTSEVVKNLESQIKGLKLISGSAGVGKGFAVKKGTLEAKGDLRVFTDADNSTPLQELEKMWPYFQQGYDIVIGSRNVKGAILDPPQPFLRKYVLGTGFKLLRKIILGLWDIEDTQCGFKVFNKRSAEAIFPKVKTLDFAFDAEVLAIARRQDFKVKEAPVYWKNDIDSKVKFKSIVKMAIDLVIIKINLIKGIYD